MIDIAGRSYDANIPSPLILAYRVTVLVIPHHFNRLNDCPTKLIRMRDMVVAQSC